MAPSHTAIQSSLANNEPLPDWMLRDIVHYMSENLLPMGMFHDARPVLVGNRLRNVTGHYPGWNAHEWDVAG
jgi:hypothetical protein